MRRPLPRIRKTASRRLPRRLCPTHLRSPRAYRLRRPSRLRRQSRRRTPTIKRKQSYAAANAERRKQIADDSAKLLKLATDLKAEVDKTSKDTLSVNVIRKADEIEKLAHSVKEKMKPAAGTN